MAKYKEARFLLQLLAYVFLLSASCRHKPFLQPLFIAKDAQSTGLNSSNQLNQDVQINALKYLYYYNGAGVGAGDFNNDGKIDLFFASNTVDNNLYVNEGKLHFKDVTKEARIPEDGGWSTGVSVVDINNDGLLDIYICRVGNYLALHSHNQLLICQGIDKNGVPYYKDEAHEYGLDFSGFSTQAVFFDYDGDGDLDMYLLNHSIHENGTFGDRSMLLKKQVPVSGDRLYRNDGNNHFTDVTAKSGINSSVLGYGLGVSVSDINLDGYPDIYVGNDFHENDYLYINQKNGAFKEELTEHIVHTSKSTMGVDVADANNDGYPEIVSIDMRASDPLVLRSSLGDDNENEFLLKAQLGYNPQYARNNLQFNRRNGMFSEIGEYAGISATDWSWAPLWMDFNNDGLKDLFVSNGIPIRLNNLDYLAFVSGNKIQEKLLNNTLDKNDLNQLETFPEIKSENKFFINQGSMQFGDIENRIANNKKTFSNGAVYADLDNDGDLDVVVNNINDKALLYENTTNEEENKKNRPYVEIKLKGPSKNMNAIGAKIFLFCKGGIRTYEKFPVRGFMSSMETPVHIGLYKTSIDSAFLVWPDKTFQTVELNPLNHFMTFTYKPGLPKFDYDIVKGFMKNKTKTMEDIASKLNLKYKHEENPMQEFNVEPLIPHMLTTEGPALAVADINHDGMEDVFIGSSKNKKNALFIQKADGKFLESRQADLEKDSACEDVSACFTDVNNDGNIDLIIAGGGDEPGNVLLQPRVYLNDGKGNFAKSENAFNNLFVNASSVVANDFNSDGNVDLFIGGRSVPGKYGEIPNSYLLQNDGQGHFRDVTKKYAEGLSGIGFVTSAIWLDIDHDGDKDLILTLEWGGVVAFVNEHGFLHKKVLCDKKGWWNFVLPVDVNNDGKIDFIAGNLGLNSRLKASDQEPVRMYYNDFDNNGTNEQILTYYVEGKEIPFATMQDLEKQIPSIKTRFPAAENFAKASPEELFTKEKLASSKVFMADYFANAILINKGNLNFDIEPMPWQAQLSCYKTAVVADANEDHLPDILLGGNFYENSVQIGRSDADFGTILLNKGDGKFEAGSINGLQIKGQMRNIKKIKIGNKEAFVIVRNNDSTMVIQFK
jgi:hypothetical protein